MLSAETDPEVPKLSVWFSYISTAPSSLTSWPGWALCSGSQPVVVLVTSCFGASFALHEVHVAVEHQNLPVQAAQRQLLDRRVTVIDEQAPLGGRDRQCHALTGRCRPM